MSVDGWAEQLLKLDYEKEKHFKESVIIIDSLQNMASGQTNMVGSADRVSYSIPMLVAWFGWVILKALLHLLFGNDEKS